MVYRIFVEKKEELAFDAKALYNEAKNLLGVSALERVRIVNRYDAENITQELFDYAVKTVFSEPQVDIASAELDVPKYTLGDASLQAVNSTASKAADGSVLITLANIDPNQAQEVTIDVRGMNIASVEATVITGPEMNSCNTFED